MPANSKLTPEVAGLERVKKLCNTEPNHFVNHIFCLSCFIYYRISAILHENWRPNYRKSTMQVCCTNFIQLESRACAFICGWFKLCTILQKITIGIHTFQVVEGPHSTSLGFSWWDCATLNSSLTLQSFSLSISRTCIIIQLSLFYTFWKKTKIFPWRVFFSLFDWLVEPTFSHPPTTFPEALNWNRNDSVHSLSRFEKTA